MKNQKVFGSKRPTPNRAAAPECFWNESVKPRLSCATTEVRTQHHPSVTATPSRSVWVSVGWYGVASESEAPKNAWIARGDSIAAPAFGENLFCSLLNHPALFLSHSLLLLALALHFTLLSNWAWLNDWYRRRCIFLHLSFEAECIVPCVGSVRDESALSEACRCGCSRVQRL
jgi:hypothetical protein